jgi:hypothetical protein
MSSLEKCNDSVFYCTVDTFISALLWMSRFDLILENKEDLAKLMVLENGKPLAEATGEVVGATPSTNQL